MNKKTIAVLVAGVILSLSATLGIKYQGELLKRERKATAEAVQQIGELKKQQQKQLQDYEAKTTQLLKTISSQEKKVSGLEKSNKELKAKNSELEGVRSAILNSTGYVPSADEVDLLERLVECEAGAEPFEGKIAVANVIQNRIKSKEFPNTIHDIIYQGIQFEPVVTGMIHNRTASADSKRAVKEALKGARVVDSNILNFWADYLPKDNPLWNHIAVSKVIGTQCFGTSWK